MGEPISIYCDWAMHDELGDDVRLSEELTMRVLDALERWKKEHGVGFDYYLIDCFWFEQPGDYTRFDPERWPNGFGPARRRMEALGMTPGLWLDATGAAVAGWRPWTDEEVEHGWAPWEQSLDVHSGWSYCLFDGPYGDGLRRAMMHAIEEWGVGLFKFDFANFYAVSAAQRHLSRGEVHARNISAFRDICRSVKAKHPEVVMLAYNGFAYRKAYLSDTTGPMVPGIEPGWLEFLDYLYSGDPRPADVPCTSLRRAVDLYQDHMVYRFHYSGIPLEHIDDHGCMVGRTNTICYLGRRGWRRTWLQSLARGGCKAHFYGDVTLLDDADVRFLDAARELYFDLFRKDAPTQLVGGVPCWDPWHGFLTGDGPDGLITLVNSSAEPQVAATRVPGLREARVLFHDEGFMPEARTTGDELSVRLAPEQMGLVGLGEKAREDCVPGGAGDADPVCRDSRRLELSFRSEGGGWECRTSGAELAEAAQGMDTLRVSFRLRREGAAARGIARGKRPVGEVLRIEVRADGQQVEPRAVVPAVRVWSGCSWVTGLYGLARLRRAEEVVVGLECPDSEVKMQADVLLEACD